MDPIHSSSNNQQIYPSSGKQSQSLELPSVRNVSDSAIKRISYQRNNAPQQRSFSYNDKRNGVPLKEPYFSQIKNGEKTVEGRINAGQFKNIRAGEKIVFIQGNRELPCTILKKVPYDSFREMLATEGVRNCLPAARNIDEGVKIYHDIPSFADRARRCGVVALRICVIKDDGLISQAVIKQPKGYQKEEDNTSQQVSRKRSLEGEREENSTKKAKRSYS